MWQRARLTAICCLSAAVNGVQVRHSGSISYVANTNGADMAPITAREMAKFHCFMTARKSKSPLRSTMPQTTLPNEYRAGHGDGALSAAAGPRWSSADPLGNTRGARPVAAARLRISRLLFGHRVEVDGRLRLSMAAAPVNRETNAVPVLGGEERRHNAYRVLI
jgi:hypothetical protein